MQFKLLPQFVGKAPSTYTTDDVNAMTAAIKAEIGKEFGDAQAAEADWVESLAPSFLLHGGTVADGGPYDVMPAIRARIAETGGDVYKAGLEGYRRTLFIFLGGPDYEQNDAGADGMPTADALKRAAIKDVKDQLENAKHRLAGWAKDDPTGKQAQQNLVNQLTAKLAELEK